ncbi:MAG: hypothetical protein JWN40_102 [Phycisphaerales bacterium]|nr:hypothetical protein [Phycisphaerales bacterium]
MADRTLSLGNLSVTGGRVVVGDAYYPPRGTEITGFPNGRFAVEAKVFARDGGEYVAEFSVECGEGGTESEVLDFSIDGGVVALADPAVQRPQSFLQRWRLRREFERQMMRGLKGVPPGLYFDSLADGTGRTWAILFYVGDGIYKVRVWRRDGSVTRLHCTLNSK